jgi:hypothetical protein
LCRTCHLFVHSRRNIGAAFLEGAVSAPSLRTQRGAAS